MMIHLKMILLINIKKCIAFDGTINNLPNPNNNIIFIKNISFNETSHTTNLHNLLEKYNNIFLK